MAIDIKKQATDLAKKAKHYLKPTLYTIVGLLLLYVIIYISVRKDHMPAQLQQTIDSLTQANVTLMQKQKQLDSTIMVYQNQSHILDGKIDDTKKKADVVSKHYRNQLQIVSSYNITELDSFFKARYNY